MKIRILPYVLLALLLPWGMAGATDFTHVVGHGDTLEILAKRYMKRPDDWAALQKINKIENPRNIPLGTVVRIPVDLLKSETVTAKVAAVQGKAWNGSKLIPVGASVSTGDELSTGADGFVTLNLADGSRLVVQPKSRVKMTQMQNTTAGGVYRTRINLINGRVDNEVAKQKDATAGYQVETPSALIAVRGTRFRVSAEGNTTRAEVTEGTVAAGKPDGESVAVQAGQGMMLKAGQPLGQPATLLPVPDLGKLPSIWERPNLRIAFAPVSGAASYHAQLATDAEFRKVVSDAAFSSSVVRFLRVPAGQVWLRVRAVDKDGLEGQDAVASFQVKASPAVGDSVEFSWEEEKAIAGYYVRVSTLEGQVVWSSDLLTTPGFKLDGLPSGDYVWQFDSIGKDGKPGPSNEPVPFSLRPLPPDLKPARLEGDKLVLSWSGKPELQYEFEMASDPAFSMGVTRMTLDKPALALQKPAGGRYFVRLRAVDEEGFAGGWGAVLSVEVPTP